ncbi:MAG: class I SAM-dependent methyltransferase [Burkholderiaceae bacterium]|nr:class I SAM-dependent methyltransferase [Burkholderiaceae bacterium]
MSMRKIEISPLERLRASPSFVLAFTMDGRPYIAKETEPYIQFWLSERYRALLSMFSGRHGATVGDALDNALRLSKRVRDPAERQRLMAAVRDMREAGVLVSTREDTSRYDARIVQAHITHRPFPRELSDRIIRDGAIGPTSRVLDLAGGPGDLALALARASDDVTLMELSKGFVSAARKRAKAAGLNLSVVHESCNRLVFNDDAYDVITVSQALHWLDDVMVCRGICRVLRRAGSFFVVHANFDVDEAHPLSFVLGRRSVLGHQPEASFADLVQALLRRLTLLFDALDSPQVHRIDPAQHWSADDGPALIVPARASLYASGAPWDRAFCAVS